METKEQIIQKLLDSKHITVEQAMILMKSEEKIITINTEKQIVWANPPQPVNPYYSPYLPPFTVTC